jgi:hypothetical protein
LIVSRPILTGFASAIAGSGSPGDSTEAAAAFSAARRVSLVIFPPRSLID